MSRWFWRDWGIAARLLAIAVLPASVMFVAVTSALYVTAQSDVRRDVAERGRFIATALAQSSQYGLVSGNVAYLRTTLRHLLEAEPSIACIDIMNAARQVVVSDCAQAKVTEPSTIEAPVRIDKLPEIDLFESDLGQVPRGTVRPVERASAVHTVGHVRVTMTPAPIFQARRQALLAASGLVLAAAVVSCLIGLQLARRLRHTLVSVLSALRGIRKGRFEVVFGDVQQGELGELQRTIVQMAQTLHAARHELEQQVATRTRELQAAVDLARQADAEKRRLIVHSNAVVEEERRRIALEMHDHLGAALTSVRLEAAALVAQAEASHEPDMARGARRIATTAESLYASTRHIVKSLRPEVIDTLGLAGAVEDLVRGLDKVHPACRFTLKSDATLPDLRGESAMPAYRVAQEALTNVVKHAGASQASVSLSRAPDQGHLRLVIQDNGRGFDTQVPDRNGIGLIGMRERVAAVGGEIVVSSAPDEGTTVCVTLPMPTN